jgi:hypothetical protein
MRASARIFVGESKSCYHLPMKIKNITRACLVFLGIAWALPMSLLGLLAGIFTIPLGSRLRYSDHAIAFFNFPFGPGGAITFGNVILSTSKDLDSICTTYQCRADGNRNELIRIGNHERAHVYQYLVLGPLFLPVYFLCGGISAKNPLERAADQYALTGSDWWPWWPNRK